MIAGTRRYVSSDLVGRLLEEFFVLLPEDFEIFRHAPEDFLVIFADPAVAQRVLHSQLPLKPLASWCGKSGAERLRQGLNLFAFVSWWSSRAYHLMQGM
jgi:hypothetical protein